MNLKQWKRLVMTAGICLCIPACMNTGLESVEPSPSSQNLLAEMPTPAPTPPPLMNVCPDVSVQFNDGRVEMRDAATQTPLLMPRLMTVHTTGKNSATLEPVVTVQTQPCGFDLHYRFQNNSQEIKPLGSLQVGIITLGETITYQDFSYEGKSVTVKPGFSFTNVGRYTYPDRLYSPVFVVRNPSYAIGISLLYPVLQYRHSVSEIFTSPGDGGNVEGEGGQGWATGFKLSDLVENPKYPMDNPASIQPGENREYVVTVRVTGAPEQWVRTLIPYRDYFHSLYGTIQSTPILKPVGHASMGELERCADDNPYGMGQTDRRPDIYGWGPMTARLKEIQAAGWADIMIFKPSGVYCGPGAKEAFNFPYQATSHWFGGEPDNHMNDAIEQLSTLPAGFLGLWWGHSAQVMDKWNPTWKDVHAFDPHNPDHVAKALVELDLAAAAGATTIGLDAFGSSDGSKIWDLVEWLRFMKKRHPQIKFVTEARGCDLFQVTTSATFAMVINDDLEKGNRLEDFYYYTDPLYLADFLFLGHQETWAMVQTPDLKRALTIISGKAPSAEELDAAMRSEWLRLSRLGYRVIISAGRELDQSYVTVPTWGSTVPVDLQY